MPKCVTDRRLDPGRAGAVRDGRVMGTRPVYEARRRCLGCDRELRFLRGRGWVHSEGCGVYWMCCGACGWEGSAHPSPRCCPECGATRELRDDHCARPRFEV